MASECSHIKGIPVDDIVVTFFLEDLLPGLQRYHDTVANTGKIPASSLKPHDLPLPQPIEITFKELLQIPAAARLMFLPPLTTETRQEISAESLADLLDNRKIGVLHKRDAAHIRSACRSFTGAISDSFVVNVRLTPVSMMRLAQMVPEGGDAHARCLLQTAESVGAAERSRERSMEAMYLLQRWGRHVHIIGNPDELLVSHFLKSMPRLQSAHWEHPIGRDSDPSWARQASDGLVSFSQTNLRGIGVGHALGHSCGSTVEYFLDGIPLGGLAKRMLSFLDVPADFGPCQPEIASLPPHALDRLRTAMASLRALTVRIGEEDCEIVTQADMNMLKWMVMSAPALEAFIMRGEREEEHDGFARISPYGKEHKSHTGFYLPAFRFCAGDRLPPLKYLHLYRYDWRQHSIEDVELHWDLRSLGVLIFTHAPLRWFLGTVPMNQLAGIKTLRLDDAEWAINPGEGRQSAVLLGYLLQYHIRALQWLELTRVYTDNLPLAGLRRHAGTLETLILRHPYGVSSGADGVGGAEMSDAVAANLTPVTLKALLESADGGMFSQLHVLEIDLDDRHSSPSLSMDGSHVGLFGGPPEGPEAELLARVAYLPGLRSLRLAVPSVLRGLDSVPCFDVDLQLCMQRAAYILGQREMAEDEELAREKQEKQEMQEEEQRREEKENRDPAGIKMEMDEEKVKKEGDGEHKVGGKADKDDKDDKDDEPTYEREWPFEQGEPRARMHFMPLTRIEFRVGGWAPHYGFRMEEHSDKVVACNRRPVGTVDGLPFLVRQVRRSGIYQLVQSSPPPSFLADSHDVDVNPSVGSALSERALKLSSQRCFVAHRRMLFTEPLRGRLFYGFSEEFSSVLYWRGIHGDLARLGLLNKGRRIQTSLPYELQCMEDTWTHWERKWDRTGLTLWM